MKNKEKYAEDIIKIACSGSRFGVNRRNVMCRCVYTLNAGIV